MDRNWRPPAAIALTVLLAAAAVAACDVPSSTPTAAPSSPATAPPIEQTPVTGNPVVIQTAWAPIWDTIPETFLVFPGAQPVEIDEPVSAALDHPAQAASPGDVAGAYATALAAAGWRTVVADPIEDGSVVVDAVRDGTSCRAQVRATPLGGIVRVTVLYGAGCPTP